MMMVDVPRPQPTSATFAPARSRRAEPLADVALGGARPRGELGRSGGSATRERLVQPELVADDDEGGGDRRAEVPHDLAHEPLELRRVDRHRCALLRRLT